MPFIHPKFADDAASTFSAMRLATVALTKVSPVPVQDTPSHRVHVRVDAMANLIHQIKYTIGQIIVEVLNVLMPCDILRSRLPRVCP